MKPATVLVVEDNPVTLKMVRLTLVIEGYRVLEARSGREALEHMSQAPDLVLQDLGLGDLDGFELAARIRATPQGRDIPLVAYTGMLSHADRARANQVGFTDFLVKPMEPSRLVEALASYLGPQRPSPAVQSPGRGCRLLVVDDDPIQLKLAAARLGDAGFAVETATTGAEALAQARRSPPSVIVTDVLMPGLDGFRLSALARRDPRLQHVPIVLMTSHYVEFADERLAGRVGASGFALRSPSFDRVVNAVVSAIEAPLPPPPERDDPEMDAQYHQRVAYQLERQVTLNAGLWDRLVLQSSSLSVLSSISRALADRQDTEGALAEALSSCLDAAGLSKGALHVAEGDGSLRIVAEVGMLFLAKAPAAPFFAPPEIATRVRDALEPLALPSPAVGAEATEAFLDRLQCRSALIVPVHARGERLGVLTLGSLSRSLADAEWLPLASAVAAQLALAIALARAFHGKESAVEALRLRERAIEAIHDGLVISTIDGAESPAIYVNPGFERITGYSAAEVLGRDCRFLQGDDADPATQRQIAEAVAGGQAIQTEILNHRKDGTPFWNALTITPLHDESGALTWFVAVMRDVTERRSVEVQLRQAQKMEAVGQLAGGVAHDFNNLLGVITGYGQLLLGELGPKNPRRRRVELILRAAERAAGLTRQLLAFGRKEMLQPRVLEMDKVVTEVVPMLRRLLGEHVQLITLSSGAPVSVNADPGHVEQIVMNLALNARDAMPEGGRLVIEVRPVDLSEDDVRDRPGALPGPHVELSVRDEGIGMTPEVRRHIFEPFFTTKEPGRGTGLGLATVYGIVKQSGGHITVESEAGKGTRFGIYLPQVEPKEVVPAVPGRPARRKRGQEAILLVEDDGALRELTKEVLERSGYRVKTASRPSDALDVARGPGAVHLFLLDVVLPEMSGPELAIRLKEIHPKARTLFVSGYTNENVARHLEADTPYLKKPFRPEELLDRVEAVLRG
jgi:PAS domain S-box-containing protein